jgi:cystathionine gamma-lyase
MSENNTNKNTHLILGGIVLGFVGATIVNVILNRNKKNDQKTLTNTTNQNTPTHQVVTNVERSHEDKNLGFETNAIHAGQHPDAHSGAVIIPISLSTTFQQHSPGVLYPGQFEYARTGNPTRNAFEECVAELEHGEWGAAFASGLSATMTITHLLNSGDHVVSMNDVYGGTFRYFSKVASKFGLSFDFIDFTDINAVRASIRQNTKLIWLETPTNPNLTIVDIEAISVVAKEFGLLFVVDNTFMSSYFQKPLDHGADLVLHSVTKYLNGHSDVVMGVVIGKDQELRTRLKFLQNAIGAIPSPFDSFLAIRGLKTLPVRMKQHAENAMIIAQYLETRTDLVDRVVYPGLPSHPQYEIACTQMEGFGGMITFFLKGGITQSRQFLENLHIFALAESLGGVESLVDHPAIMTHASVPPEERAKLGISDSLVRLSVGIESVDDLMEDLKHALSFVKL